MRSCVKQLLLTCTLLLPALLRAGQEFSLNRTDGGLVVTCGGAEFRFTDGRTEIEVRDGQKWIEPLIVNARMSDGCGSRRVVRRGRSCRRAVLEDGEVRKVVRVDCPLDVETDKGQSRPFDSAHLEVFYLFMRGVPGVRVVQRLTADNGFAVHAYNVCAPYIFARYAVDGGETKPYPSKPIAIRPPVQAGIVAETKGGTRWFFSKDFACLAGGGSFLCKPPVVFPAQGQRFNPGMTAEFAVTVGRVLDESDVGKLSGLADALPAPAAEQPADAAPDAGLVASNTVYATALLQPLHGAGPDWSTVPVGAVRGEVKDFRPLASNKWSGPNDLSWELKVAFDMDWMYFHVDVTDDVADNPMQGEMIWKGDSIQFAFDPQQNRDGRGLISFAISTVGEKPCLWGFFHPDGKYVGDIFKWAKDRSHRREGGIVYDFALPMAFFQPFDLSRGQMNFSFAVIDRDGGAGIDSWMPLTDGVFGGRDASKFSTLEFRGAESVFVAAQKTPMPKSTFPSKVVFGTEKTVFGASVVIADRSLLPAELVVDIDGTNRFSRSLDVGYNSFALTLRPDTLAGGAHAVTTAVVKDGRRPYSSSSELVVVSRDYLASLIADLEGRERYLSGKFDAMARIGKKDDYLESACGLLRYIVAMARFDLDLKSVEKAHYNAVPVTREYRVYMYDRMYKNLTYSRTLADRLSSRADEILVGSRRPERFVEYPKDVRPVIADGGFKVDGKEIILVGPNTWTNVRSYDDAKTHWIADTGMNYMNIFYVGGTRRDNLLRLSREHGLYFSYGGTTSYDPSLPRDVIPESHRNTLWSNHVEPMRPDPRNMVFSIVQGEAHLGRLVFGVPGSDVGQPVWNERFRETLKRRYGSLERLNARLGASYTNWEQVVYADTLVNKRFKWEVFKFRQTTEFPAEKREYDWKRERWGVPVSTHFSTHYHFTGLDPVRNVVDFENIWRIVDICGFDGGVAMDGSEFFIDFAKGGVDLDLARSFYPEKPCANNENHIILDGVYCEYSDEAVYLSHIYTHLLGLNASSVWEWAGKWHEIGEYAFTRANTYHAMQRVATDLRCHPEEIGAFRRAPNPPFRILHSLPSMVDRDEYMRSFYGLYAGLSFTGWPVRYLSEKMVEADDFRGAKVIVVPEAHNVSDATFDALVRFAQKGGKVLVHGRKALRCDDYGWPVPARDAAMAHFTVFECSGTVDYDRLIRRELAVCGEKPPVSVTGKDGKPLFGVQWRNAMTAAGEDVCYVLNLNRQPVEVCVGGKWTEIRENRELPATTALKPGELLLLKRKGK